MGRYHGCRQQQQKKKRPNISPTENNTLPSCLNKTEVDLEWRFEALINEQ